MKLLAALLISLLTSAAHAGQAAEQVNAYFDLWLKDHQFHAYEKRSDGIRFTANNVLMDGDIYEVKELTPGKFYSAESRISVTFPDGRKLEDFVVGVGKDPKEAFFDSLQNFCLTTLHPIYAEFFDHADPHVRKMRWTVDGRPRRVFMSSWGERGEPIPAATQADIEQLLSQELKERRISGDIHWIKLVVFESHDKVETVVLTIDGLEDARMSAELKAYPWPHPKKFSLTKLFLVLGKD